MTQQVCPFLGTLDSQNRRGPHVEFPSFENQCLAGATPELILLGDQAMYCLGAACVSCPRYRTGSAYAQDQALGTAFVPFVNTAEDTWTANSAVSGPELAMLGTASLDEDDAGSRARWGKLGAALIFATVLLCGSLTAAYSGWQWVTRDLRPQTAGRVDVAGNTGIETSTAGVPTPAVYVVMTATPQPVVVAPPQQPGAGNAGDTGIIPVLPQAVTPTPIRIDPGTPSVLLPAARREVTAQRSVSPQKGHLSSMLSCWCPRAGQLRCSTFPRPRRWRETLQPTPRPARGARSHQYAGANTGATGNADHHVRPQRQRTDERRLHHGAVERQERARSVL
ncbi:MAG: hypothetical protein U0X20_09590 [Caldilineaceae bacterium]